MKPRNKFAYDDIMRKGHVHVEILDEPDDEFELIGLHCECGGALITDGYLMWCLDCGLEIE